MRIFLFWLLVVSLISDISRVLGKDEPTKQVEQTESEEFKPTPDQTAFIELVEARDNAIKRIWAHYEKLKDKSEWTSYYSRTDPNIIHLPKLLKFEEEHRGTEIGFLAAIEVYEAGGSGGFFNCTADVGRREAYQRLLSYTDRPELVFFLRLANTGNFESKTEEFLRSIAKSDKALPECREYAEIQLAKRLIQCHDWRESISKRIQLLKEGAKPFYTDELANLTAEFESYPSEKRTVEMEAEGIALLEKLSQSKSEFRFPEMKKVDPKWHIKRIDKEATKKASRFSDIAAGILFKERHLKVGKPAAELSLKLVSGDNWSLESQKGKVVVVQFSLKGCGPCEAMYPDLREIQKMHRDAVSIVSIMNDEELQPRALRAGR